MLRRLITTLFSRPYTIPEPDFVYPTAEPSAHIVYCEKRMLLTKRRYRNWREIQDEHADYKASLGPYTRNDILGLFGQDFGDVEDWPFSPSAIEAFFAADEQTVIERRHG